MFGIHDDDGRSEEIDRMYAHIWRDPRMAGAVALWRRVKERHGRGGAGRPSRGTHEADIVMLSTAAGLAARGEAVELLTFHTFWRISCTIFPGHNFNKNHCYVDDVIMVL